jgi:FAD binding domain/Berberine and berberine like
MSTEMSRRKLLSGTTLVGAGGLATALLPARPEVAAADTGPPAGFGGAIVTRDDQRYADLVRSWNGRFVGQPEYVRVVGSTAQVEQAVAEAVQKGKRLAVRSGGHCLEGFVTDPSVQVQLDMSQLSAIYYDADRRAIVVEPGATLRDVFKRLFAEWSVTLPGGTCPSVGAGGHICGGGFGALARRSGLTSDHVYAVEVVTVDGSGTPRTVVATSDAHDPNRDLWWAHTGGGGGNFGVVTRYWLRTPGATGSDPSGLLPRPPKRIHRVVYSWPWSDLDKQAFTGLVRNYLSWHAENSAPDSPYARVYANLVCFHERVSPTVRIDVQVDPTESDSGTLLSGFRSAVVDPVAVRPTVTEQDYSWLESTNVYGWPDTGTVVGLRNKTKGSNLRRSYTDAQIATLYHYLTETGIPASVAAAGLQFNAYGGRANAVKPDATAVPQRDSVVKVTYAAHWANPADDDTMLSWIRTLYRDLFAGSGGVPELDGIADGTYITYLDTDLADPAWNTSGIPWWKLYYKDNYARLQQVKARWDPRNMFHHALSVRLPT